MEAMGSSRHESEMLLLSKGRDYVLMSVRSGSNPSLSVSCAR